MAKIKSRFWYQNNIVDFRQFPARPPKYKKPEFRFSTPLQKFLEKKGIQSLYLHQVEAIENILQGRNVIITTSTSSGKTLSYLIPILETLSREPATRALLIYPLKALTNDQRLVLKEIKEINFEAAVYDGDTPAQRRSFIRNEANIILTNPYELHQVLPYHFKWQEFFRNLRFIVIDEAHKYKGVFGSNVANLIYRLKRILDYYAVQPVYILSSASIGNPAEFAFRLTAEKFYHISEDGSPQSRKVLLLWNSKNSRLSYLEQVKEIFSELINSGFKTICFLKTRRSAELIKSRLGPEKEYVASYRAGYLPEVRREIEAKLKSGQIKGVLSTNALELGIDIGELDAVVIAGFPGSISSFWQQAGRAGRRQKEALIFYIGLDDALEQYLLNQPQILLQPEFEKMNIEPHNIYIRSRHLLCASSELPLKEDEIKDSERNILNTLLKKGFLSRTSRGYIYTAGGRPQGYVSLDNISEDSVELLVEGKVYETMDYARALRELYPGAVYLSQGKTYLIQKLNLKDRIAEAEEKKLDYYTELVQQEEVELKEVFKSRSAVNYTLNYGLSEIKESFPGYRIKKFNQVLGFKELNLPELKFNASAIWLELDSTVREAVQAKKLSYAGGLHALEHLLIALAPLIASCDRNDLGGRSYSIYPAAGSSGIFIFEGYQGGVGIAERLYNEFDRFLDTAREHILNCKCENGCPSCILSPKCGNNNIPLDKSAAIFILSYFSS